MLEVRLGVRSSLSFFLSRSFCCQAGILGLEGLDDAESFEDEYAGREGDEIETEPVLLSLAGTTVGSFAGEGAGRVVTVSS